MLLDYIKQIIAVFQFHTGSIKSDIDIEKGTLIVEFQFHTGSIKR